MAHVIPPHDPVSYTHLDVYKRQVHMEPAGDDNQGAVFIAKLGQAFVSACKSPHQHLFLRPLPCMERHGHDKLINSNPSQTRNIIEHLNVCLLYTSRCV